MQSILKFNILKELEEEKPINKTLIKSEFIYN